MIRISDYLGDGLTVEYDGHTFRLFTPRGTEVHEVYLEPQVLHNFMNFVSRMKKSNQIANTP